MQIESYNGIQILYTICFCRYIPSDKILLIKRIKRPHTNKWNGLGGKIEAYDKDRLSSVHREIMEEAQIDLKKAQKVWYAGLVTWDVSEAETKYQGGMYTYIADFDENLLFAEKETREGKLEWKPQLWVLDKSNNEVVENIPLFLSEMLQSEEPIHCHCTYVNGVQSQFEVLPYESK